MDQRQTRVVLPDSRLMRPQNLNGVCVMTDDQIEQLQKQIAVYAVISEQLVEMHKAYTAQPDLTGVNTYGGAGMKMGNVYGDNMMAFGGSEVPTRQRWTPTNTQLEILERIYSEGNGTQGKPRVKEITKELEQHGQVIETNVYNWFQNRRARSKRKQSGPTRTNKDANVQHDFTSPSDKKAKSDELVY